MLGLAPKLARQAAVTHLTPSVLCSCQVRAILPCALISMSLDSFQRV